MKTDEFFSAIVTGELRRQEFKEGGSLNNADYRAKIFRAMLAMANTRDGGSIIIGVEDKTLKFNGIIKDDLSSWHQDFLADKLSPYTEPHISFTFQKHQHNDRIGIHIEVEQFSEHPIICMKNAGPTGKQTLQEGKIYIRPLKGKPQSCKLRDPIDMRELITLATQQGIRSFLNTAQFAGMSLKTSELSNEQLFNAQENDFL